MFPLLEELRIGEWNANATGVDKCHRLERLYVRNFKPSKGGLAILPALKNLLIMGCSDIPSIAFVSRLKKLESFGLLDTTVKDGKLDPLLSLERLTMVGITDKKHYSHKDAQLRKLIEGRRSSVS